VILQVLGFLLIGLVAGFCSGLFGIGGGVIIVPLLIWIFKFNQMQASGTSLTSMLLPLGAMAGVYQYLKNGSITSSEVKLGIIASLGMFIGAFYSAKIAAGLSSVFLKRGFALVLALSAIQLWLSAKK
jgi:hypothetical protein